MWESVYCTACQKKWANRGFLYGPICPIYGSGCVIALAINDLTEKDVLPSLTWWQIFILGFAVSMILEYPTSFVLEKLFHARWGDYSKVPLNIKGRTSMPTSVAFGAASIAVMKFVLPAVSSFIMIFPDWLITMTALIFTAIISADLTLTASALTDFQNMVKRLDESFQNRMTDAVYNIISAENDFRRKAVKRIAVFKFPTEKAKSLTKDDKHHSGTDEMPSDGSGYTK